MRRTATAVLALATFTAATTLRANDSVAEMAAGGLVLKQSDDIDMLSEDLYVSADEIRVRYVFRNRRSDDVRVTVAFPLPDHDLIQDFYGDVAYPSDFRTLVDGRPVAMQVEHRAFRNGTDHTVRLAGLGIPIMYGADGISALESALSALPSAEQDRLVALDLAEPAGGRRITPMWTVRETWHWEQVFPTGRDLVVEHQYTPGTGGSVETMLAYPDMRGTPEAQREYAQYCVDGDFIAAVDRMRARGTAERPAVLGEQKMSYILTTGGNWRSPIGDFRLVVDKGRPENIVSFCGTGVRRIGPTQFELRRRNWRPDRDLAVLIVRPNREE